MYIQQADGNKRVWAFSFLFVSESWLIEQAPLLSYDARFLFLVSQVYYLKGVMKQNILVEKLLSDLLISQAFLFNTYDIMTNKIIHCLFYFVRVVFCAYFG